MTEMQQFFEETGRRGGKKAAANMTPEQRRERARKAGLVGAAARWGNAKVRRKARASAKPNGRPRKTEPPTEPRG